MQRKRTIFGVLFLLCVFLVFWRSGTNEGVTPLMVASKAGDVNSVREIVSNGVDLDETSAYGWSALMFAAWQGHEEVVRTLVEAGADTDIISRAVPASFSTTANHPPSTALFEAISNENLKIANYLLERGAKVDTSAMAIAGWRGNPILLSAMVKSGGQINGISDNEFYRTPLSVAAQYGNNENLTWLLANGADPNLPIPHSSNLQRAVRGLNPDAVMLLIEAGAEVDALIPSRNVTALNEAIYSYSGNKHAQRVQIVELLLASGANPHFVRDEFDIPLVEHVEISIQRGIEGVRDREKSGEVRERYRRSLAANRSVMNLLKAYSE